MFAAEPLAGNGLAVVHDADDLDDATMLAFARETRQSETTFVQRARSDAADYRNRIWMMRGELPFAGHPSLGTAVAVAHRRGERSATYVQETPAGRQPIDVELDGERGYASMLQEPVELGPELDAGEVLRAAGLTAADADPQLPVQVVSTGAPQVIAPVRPEALGRVRADREALRAVLEPFEAVTLYLAASRPAEGTARARALYVEPGGTAEDPATGSAAGPLCAYLHARAGVERLSIEQGLEMERPSHLECAVEGDRVRVGGGAVVVATGTLTI